MPREPRLTVQKVLVISEEMAAAIDEYRWNNRIASEGEAMRQILAAGLAALKSKKKPAEKDIGSRH